MASAPSLQIKQSPPVCRKERCSFRRLSIRAELQRPDTVQTLRKKMSLRKGVFSYVSGFISLARVSTNSGTNCSTKALHSLEINPTGMRSQEPSNTSLSSSCWSEVNQCCIKAVVEPGFRWTSECLLPRQPSPCRSCTPAQILHRVNGVLLVVLISTSSSS